MNDLDSPFFEYIINLISDTIFIFNQKTYKAIKWNNAFRDISGYTDYEIGRMKAPEAWYSADDLKKADSATEKLIRGERALFEMSLITKSGERIPFEYSSSILFDKHTNTDYIIVIGRSLLERKKIERNLRASEERYRNFIANASEGIFRIDFREPININKPYKELEKLIAETAIVGEVNTALANMYGLTPEEMTGKPVRIYAPNCGTQMADMLATEDYKIVEREEVEVDDDGNPLYIVESYNCIVEEGILKRVWGVQRNITKRKLIEKEITREKIFTDTVINSLPGIFFVFNSKGNLVRWNENHKKILGFTDEEMRNHSYLNVFEQDKNLVREKIKDLMEHGHTDMEIRLVRKDGSLTPFFLNGVKMEVDNETYIVGHGIDISERIDFERKLLHVQKLESLGVLAGGIAHDFNNLLMAIIGSLDVISKEIPSTTKSFSELETAINAAKRAADLTTQMLAYSGQGDFIKKNFNLNTLLKENASIFRAAIPKTIDMKLNTYHEDVMINADPGQVQQIIMNLITNAAEAMENSAGTITMSSGIRKYSKHELARSQIQEKPEPGIFVYLEVSDNGKGMSKSIQNSMFDPFFTTKFTGRGLGMSAVMGIVRGHKGAIFVYSEENKGTTIRVVFPEVKEAGSKEEIREKTEDIIELQKLINGEILIIDDDPDVLKASCSLVEYLGFETLTAEDGIEGLSILEKYKEKIILVLLDLTMPNLDGVQTFEEMQNRGIDIPVILTSGFSEQEAVKKFKSKGLTGFLQKPYLLDTLKLEIKKALQIK